MIDVLFIAMACHEGNKALCQSNGDYSQQHWDQAEEWQRESAIAGVQWRLDNPGAQPGGQHQAWMNHKINDGWKYGPVKSAEIKEHPSLLPFNELSEFEQKKDALFMAIVDALK